jgi:hypothetical protein
MAAGLGFKDFTTGEVLTAADVDGYLMQGVWVFASAAARDAAVTSPQEGNFAYLKDTNVTTYYTGSAWANLDTTGMTNPMTTTGDTIYSSSGSTPARLGIGSTGNVLTVAGGVPTWAAPAAGGANYSLLSTTSLSGTTTTVSGISGKEKLLISIIGASSSGSQAGFYIRINGDTGTNYNYAGNLIAANGTYAASQIQRIDANGGDWVIAGQMAASATSTVSVSMAINGGTTTGGKEFSYMSGANAGGSNSQYNINAQGVYLGSAAITSISFITDSGSFDAGTIYIYGSAV